MARAEQTDPSHPDVVRLRALPFGQLAEILLIEAEVAAATCSPDHHAEAQIEAVSLGLSTSREVIEKASYGARPQNPFTAIDSLKSRITSGLKSGTEHGRPWTDTDLRSALSKMCREQSRIGIAIETDFIRQTALERLSEQPGYQLSVLLALAAEDDVESYKPGVNALLRRLEDPEPFGWQEASETFYLVLGCLENDKLEGKPDLVEPALILLAEMKSYTDNEWSTVDYAVAVAHLSSAVRQLPPDSSVGAPA